MKTSLALVAAGTVMLSSSVFAMEGHEHSNGQAMKMDEKQHESALEKPQSTCPVMGGKIDKSVYADHDGKRVYFCCADCKGTFLEDPAKYMKKVEANGETLEVLAKPQETCPVMGGKIDKSIFADHEGKRVYFCCGSCKAEFKKSPQKYLKKLEEMGEEPGRI